MAAYEAGEIDMLLPVPTEDIQRVKDDPVLSTEYTEVAALAITYYNYNNGNDPDRQGSSRAARIPRRARRRTRTSGSRSPRPSTSRPSSTRPSPALGKVAARFVMPGIPGATPTTSRIRTTSTPPRPAWPRPWQELGYASAADIPAAQVRLQLRRRPRAASRLPGPGLATAFGLETEQIGSEFGVFLTQRTAGEYDIARNGWGADYPHANNQLAACSPAVAATTTSVLQRGIRRLLAQAAAEPDQATQDESTSRPSSSC